MGVSSWLVFCVRAAYAHGTVRQWTFTIRHTFDAVAKARTTSAAAARHCLNTVIARSPCDEAIHAGSAAAGWIARNDVRKSRQSGRNGFILIQVAFLPVNCMPAITRSW